MEIENHLAEVRQSNMNLSIEMRELIKAERQSLLALCEKQMRIISSVVALVIIAAIYLFLSSAYSPIFALGEII